MHLLKQINNNKIFHDISIKQLLFKDSINVQCTNPKIIQQAQDYRDEMEKESGQGMGYV